MDTVFLTGLRVDAVIGIYDWEREIRQTLVVDLQMATDIRQAAATDDINFTLNYKSISDRLVEYIGSSSFGLIETLAERIAQIVKDEFDVAWVRVTLHKPGAVPAADDVGVIIERGSRAASSA